MTLKQGTATLVGTAPLLHHSSALADPTHPLARQMKEINGLTKKTDADQERRSNIEWLGAMYVTPVGRDNVVCLPAMNVLRSWQEGGKQFRKGTAIEQSLVMTSPAFPLTFDHAATCAGPDGWHRLYDLTDAAGDPLYVDRRIVNGDPSKGKKGPRVVRCRPIFRTWSLPVSFAFEDDAINPEDLLRALEYAAVLRGIGDYRPHFGKFRVEGWDVK